MLFRIQQFVALTVFLGLGQAGFAQNPDLIIKNVSPPSPEASALGKYGEYPVSLYSGVPNISIPIWTVSSKQISIPISISYHASGIRIDEIATNVGLGWVLNASGVVIRSRRGLADDLPNGYYDATFTESTIQQGTFVRSIADGDLDGESDMFYFNFAGHSGRFFFNLDHDLVQIEKSELIIEETHENEFIEFIASDNDRSNSDNNISSILGSTSTLFGPGKCK